MIRKIFTLVCAVLSMAFVSCSSAGSPRTVYNFNNGWRLFVGDAGEAAQQDFDDTQWKEVTLPHAWNEDDAFRVAINRLGTGIAWYRKTFRLPASAAGQKIFLEFEGVRQAATVYVNGEQMILHENGAMAFGIDISSVARFGK